MIEITTIESIVKNVVSAQLMIPSIVTFLICIAIILLTPALLKLVKREDDLSAVQASHIKPTLRIGGIGILIGLLVGLFLLKFDRELVSYASILLVTAIPLIIAGFAEDIGLHLRPSLRLGVIAFSSLFCAVLLPSVISKLGLIWLDGALGYYPIALLFTIFAATGVTNAFNLIDGLNGLASFTAITTSVALAAIAKIAGLDHLQYFYSLITIVTFGFFLLNYPFGKLFLGDGGAYLLGFCLVWGGITLANQVAGLSAFAVLLIFFWPIADTLLAIWRRIKLSSSTSRPDRLHFHQLVMRFLEIRVLGRRRRQLTNPLATFIISPLIVAPQICGLIFAFDHFAAVVSSVLFSLLFILAYAIGIYLAKRSHVRWHTKA